MSASQPTFQTLRPGRLDYRAGLALQERLLARPDLDSDLLILLEHPPTITIGRGGKEKNLLAPMEQLNANGIEVHRVGRGGDVTYHGPGQLVGYPLVDLSRQGRDLHLFLRNLEEILILLLARFNLQAHRHEGKTGIWIGAEKIASIGIGVRKWISWHGFALNLQKNLEGFNHIIPCGLSGVRMTSMEEQLGYCPERGEIEDAVIGCFAETFQSRYAGPYEDPTT